MIMHLKGKERININKKNHLKGKPISIKRDIILKELINII